jgi:hypothetical protein
MSDEITVVDAAEALEPPPTGAIYRGVPRTTSSWRRVNQTRLPRAPDPLSPWRSSRCSRLSRRLLRVWWFC